MFDKYEKYGAYHWQDSDRTNVYGFSLPLWTRYNVILERIDSSMGKGVEIGCGDGALTYLIAKKNIREMSGCDTDECGIKLAKQRIDYEDRGQDVGDITLYNRTFEQCNFDDESLDFVVMADVVEHLDNPELLLGQIRRKLKIGGVLLITTPHKREHGLWDENHVIEFDKKSLSELLLKYYEEVNVNMFMHRIFHYLYNRHRYIKAFMNLLSMYNLNLLGIKNLSPSVMLFASARKISNG